MTLRGLLGYACAGSAGTLAWRGDWRAAAVAGGCTLLLAVWWVRREFAATRARLREGAEMSAALADVEAARVAGLAGRIARVTESLVEQDDRSSVEGEPASPRVGSEAVLQ